MQKVQNIPAKKDIDNFFELIDQSFDSQEAVSKIITLCSANRSMLSWIDKDGHRPIDFAAFRGCLDIVNYFLNEGVSPNEPNNLRSGCFPIHFAALGGRIDVLILLIERGAHPDSKSHDGKDIQSFSKESQFVPCINFCRDEQALNEARSEYLLNVLLQEDVSTQSPKFYSESTTKKTAMIIRKALLSRLESMMSTDALQLARKIISVDSKNKPNTALAKFILRDDFEAKFERGDLFVLMVKGFLKNLTISYADEETDSLLPHELWLKIISNCDENLANITKVNHLFSRLGSIRYFENLQKKWLVKKQLFYGISFTGLCFIDQTFTAIKTLSLHGNDKSVTYFYPKSLKTFFDVYDDPFIWYVLADNVIAFKQHCRDNFKPIGQQRAYLPLALAFGRQLMVSYLLSLKIRTREKHDDPAEVVCDFTPNTLEEFLNCAIVSRKIEMIDSVLAIPGAVFDTLYASRNHAFATGVVAIAKKLLEVQFSKAPLGIDSESVSAAINSGNVEMLKIVIQAYSELLPEDIKPWQNEVNLAWGEESVMAKQLKTICENWRAQISLRMGCYEDKQDMIMPAIRNGADVNAVDYGGRTPIFSAIVYGNTKAVELLCLNKANVHQTDKAGCTPLIIASALGRTDIVKLLLDHEAQVHRCNLKGASPLLLAVHNCHLGVVRLLTDAGADPDYSNEQQVSALSLATSRPGHKNLYILISLLSALDVSPAKTTSILILALNLRKDEVIIRLLNEIVDVDVNRNSKGDTPLCITARQGNIVILKEILKKQPKVNSSNFEGESPLFIAAQSGRSKVVKILIASGGNVNQPREDGYTPILIASERGHIDTVRALLRAKVDPEKLTLAADLAKKNGHEEIVTLLHLCQLKESYKNQSIYKLLTAILNTVTDTSYKKYFVTSEHDKQIKNIIIFLSEIEKNDYQGINLRTFFQSRRALIPRHTFKFIMDFVLPNHQLQLPIEIISSSNSSSESESDSEAESLTNKPRRANLPLLGSF